MHAGGIVQFYCFIQNSLEMTSCAKKKAKILFSSCHFFIGPVRFRYVLYFFVRFETELGQSICFMQILLCLFFSHETSLLGTKTIKKTKFNFKKR